MAIIFYFRYYFNELELKTYFIYQIIFQPYTRQGAMVRVCYFNKTKISHIRLPMPETKKW